MAFDWSQLTRVDQLASLLTRLDFPSSETTTTALISASASSVSYPRNSVAPISSLISNQIPCQAASPEPFQDFRASAFLRGHS